MTDHDLVYDEYLRTLKQLDTLQTQLNNFIKQNHQSTIGAFFHFHNKEEPVFIPAFQPINITEEEKPYKFEINFDQTTVVNWLTACKDATEQTTD